MLIIENEIDVFSVKNIRNGIVSRHSISVVLPFMFFQICTILCTHIDDSTKGFHASHRG